MRRKVSLLFLLFLSLLCKRPEGYEETRLLLGTYVRIKVYKMEKERAKGVIDRAFKEIARIDSITSTFSQESEVFRLNRKGKGVVSSDLKRMIEKALYISEITDGAFDITVYPLEELWGFYTGRYRVPTDSEIRETLKSVNYKNVVVKGDSVYLLHHTRIDLAGIAKGYAVDRAVEVLKREGIDCGLVDAGGDIRVFGRKRGGFRIGLKHPRKEGIFKVFKIKEGAIATSGDYEKFFIKRGKRYCHIIDPHTGYPAHRCVSATILTDKAMTADALATALFVLGPDRGERLADSLGKKALFIYEERGELKGEGSLK